VRLFTHSQNQENITILGTKNISYYIGIQELQVKALASG